MNKLLLTLIGGCTLAMSFSLPAYCGDIVGTVVDSNGNPLQGLQVIVKAQNSQMTGAAITNQTGQYQIEGLNSGLYYITLDPKGTSLAGQTVVTNLNDNGLTVNWATAPGRPAIASAQPGVQQSSAGSPGPVVADSSKKGEEGDGNSPPGCKGMPGPPCGPKKSDKH
jgi:Carboxypeptidase regulatory-like domain